MTASAHPDMLAQAINYSRYLGDLVLVLTFMGRDKPGLANAISETIAAAGGSWMDSRLARLADKFAGIVLINVPEPNVADLSAALRSLNDAGLRITIEPSSAAQPE